jgi:hypothetical protein
MKKYYIGLAVLAFLALGAVGYTISQGSSAKKDKQTNDKFKEVASKLDPYTYNGSSLPSSLSAVGLKDIPPTIQYTKVSSTKFKLCVTYYNNSNLFDSGWYSLLGGYTSTTSDSNSSLQQTDTKAYIDTMVIYSHKKGENCQTVQTSSGGYGYIDDQNSTSGTFSGDTEIKPPSPSASYSSSVCSASYNDLYTVQGNVTISKIDTSAKVIYFSSDGQSWQDQNGTAINMAAVASKKYDSITAFCDASAKPTDVSSFKAGDKAKVFLSDNKSLYVDKVQH